MYKKMIVGLLVITAIYFLIPKQQNSLHNVTQKIAPTPAVLGVQTKTSNCLINGAMPDKECTPGSVFSSVTKDEICVSGYSKTVRNVPESEKRMVYEEYGIGSHTTGEYEVDHYISLELGGSNDLANLWPEPAEPIPGFHEKDKVENYLHQQVCGGIISLQQAQTEIMTNWLQIYQQLK